MLRSNFFLIIIILIGGILRFYDLAGTPPSLSHDEVAIGYNAFSILKTGRDEYGLTLPLLFRSFDDYKLPGMMYASIPSILIFGLNEIGVRFPSAFLGTLTVLVFYFLVRELVRKHEVPLKETRSATNYLPLISSFFLAISPWHINFSRQAFESNGALFFLVLGTYFLIASSKKTIYLLFAAVIYAISFYFYYSVRLIIPFILLAFTMLMFKQLLKHKRIAFLSLLIGIVILLPFVPLMFSKGGMLRMGIVSVVNDENYFRRNVEFARTIDRNNTIFTRIIYNRRVALIITVIENYLKNMSFDHIFLKGTTSSGLLYIFEAPFFSLGIYYLFRLKTPMKWIIIVWFVSAPVAGAITFHQPNALRTLPNAPIFSLLSGLGFAGVFNLLKGTRIRFIYLLLFVGAFIFYFSRFLNAYFIEFPQKNAINFGDGYKQMVKYVKENENKYKAIYISGYYWRPYIFTLFWKAYDPGLYQKDRSIEHFGKYYFSGAQWDKEGVYFGEFDINFYSLIKTENRQETLFVLAMPEFERNKRKFKKFSVIDGKYAKAVFVAAVLK